MKTSRTINHAQVLEVAKAVKDLHGEKIKAVDTIVGMSKMLSNTLGYSVSSGAVKTSLEYHGIEQKSGRPRSYNTWKKDLTIRLEKLEEKYQEARIFANELSERVEQLEHTVEVNDEYIDGMRKMYWALEEKVSQLENPPVSNLV